MNGCPTDHAHRSLPDLHRDVVRGKAGGQVIWQPRIGCWYDDRVFRGEPFPEPYTGLDLPGIYRKLGCSNRNYMFGECCERVYDPQIRRKTERISPREDRHLIETPLGTLSSIVASNDSNGGRYEKKFWITDEQDMEIMTWVHEHSTWRWNHARQAELSAVWGDLGLPTLFLPRCSLQDIFVTTMGVENGVYALMDYPKTVEKYLAALEENTGRLIDVLIGETDIEVINFGDNIHAGVLSPELFLKYVRPEYIRRNTRLRAAGKFTHAHWDGDVKMLLPYAADCGLSGIEAVTPLPQGDVTLREVRDAFGSELYLLDGIAALLFEDDFPLADLERQTRECLELFGGRLVLGISDEISSRGNLDRIRFVGDLVDEYNSTCR